jgi:hypothetical protein
MHEFGIEPTLCAELLVACKVMQKTRGYCWPTPKCRNMCVQHAFLEGKKAGETSPRKSTPRTLKEVGQQYPRVFCDRPFSHNTFRLHWGVWLLTVRRVRRITAPSSRRPASADKLY